VAVDVGIHIMADDDMGRRVVSGTPSYGLLDHVRIDMTDGAMIEAIHDRRPLLHRCSLYRCSLRFRHSLRFGST
jgi:hypothetical protein